MTAETGARFWFPTICIKNREKVERNQQVGVGEILLDLPQGMRIVPAFQVPERLKTPTRLKGEVRVGKGEWLAGISRL